MFNLRTWTWAICLVLLGAFGCGGEEDPLVRSPAVESSPTGASGAPAAEVPRDEHGFEIRTGGAWYTGDLHVHSTGASNDTGGNSFPEDIATRALQQGLQFIVLTDHSNSTGSDPTTTDEDPDLFNLGPEFPTWQKAQSLSIPDEFWMISGNELSPVAEGDPPGDPRGHIGCIPLYLDGFDQETPFIDRPRGDVSGGSVLSQALDRGCFTVLNHPYALLPWIAYDWTGDGYHAIEVWNGSGNGFDEYDFHSYNAWRCDLLEGKRVTPVGASDNHRIYQEPPGDLLNPALGWPSTQVWSPEPTWEGILHGLVQSDVQIFEGESRLSLEAFTADKNISQGSGTRYLRVRGKLDPHAAESTLRIRRATACSWSRTPDSYPKVSEDFVFEATVEPGEIFSHVVPVTGAVGVYTATLLEEDPPPLLGIHYAALSGSVVILQD